MGGMFGSRRPQPAGVPMSALVNTLMPPLLEQRDRDVTREARDKLARAMTSPAAVAAARRALVASDHDGHAAMHEAIDAAVTVALEATR